MPRFLHPKAAPRQQVAAAVVTTAGSSEQFLFNESYAAAATISVAPSTFAAPAGVSNVSSQLLDGSGSETISFSIIDGHQSPRAWRREFARWRWASLRPANLSSPRTFLTVIAISCRGPSKKPGRRLPIRPARRLPRPAFILSRILSSMRSSSVRGANRSVGGPGH